MKKITLSKETDPKTGAYLVVRADEEIVRVFTMEQEEEARRFFESWEACEEKSAQILAERYVDGSRKAWLGNVVAYYRGCTITDRPHGDTSPFTIVLDGEVIQHRDEVTIQEIFDTIDELLAMTDKHEEHPEPDWKENQRRLNKWNDQPAGTPAPILIGQTYDKPKISTMNI